MKTTARGYFVGVIAAGLAGSSPVLRAELTAVQRAQAQASAVAVAAGNVFEADKHQPEEASPADRAEWLERRGRWLLRDERLLDARNDFLEAKKLTPNSVPVAAGLAEVALQRGRKEEAMALIKAAAELRKEEDPDAQFYGFEPGVRHIFLLLLEMNGGGLSDSSLDVIPFGDALPDALLMVARKVAKEGNVASARDLSTRAITEAGGKFPAAERLRQAVRATLAQAEAMEPSAPELGRLRFFAETQLANGEVFNARRAAEEALKSGQALPTFSARQLLWARVAAAVAFTEDRWPDKSSEVNANTLEAVHVLVSTSEPEAAALPVEKALLKRLRQIDPLWPAGSLPAPAKLMADSPLRQALTGDRLSAGADRVVALEKAFLAAWGRGPTAVDLGTAEGRARWGEIGREGALIAHLRWLTLPRNSEEAAKAWANARQRTTLALLCAPEDTAALHAAKRHPWFNESGGRDYVSGPPGVLTQKLKTLLAGKHGRDSAPPENGETLSAYLTDVMPLAEGATDLPRTCPGIATVVAVRVTNEVGRLRMTRQEDVAYIASTLANFVWEWTADPARAMDVTDWGDAQLQMPSVLVRFAFQPPAGLEKTPLGRHVLELDAWLWNGADPKTKPMTPEAWVKVPSVAWRHALGSGGTSGNFRQRIEANRSGEGAMCLSISSSAGQAVQLLDKRLGEKMVAPMNATVAAAWFSSLAEIAAMVKEGSVTPEVRTRLGKQLNLHRVQVLIASGQRELALKELPALVAQLEYKPRPLSPYRSENNSDLVEILPKDPKVVARERQLERERTLKLEAERNAAQARGRKEVVAEKCRRCLGTGEIYDAGAKPGTDTYMRVDGTRLTEQRSRNNVRCPACGGSGQARP